MKSNINSNEKKKMEVEMKWYTTAYLTVSAYDVKWLPFSAKVVIVGNYSNRKGTLQIYELQEGKLEQIIESEKGSALKCLTLDNSSFLDRHVTTGAFDGRVMMWDLQNLELPIWSVKGHTEIINSIDGVGGNSTNSSLAPEIVTGSKDGTVKVWDPRTKVHVGSIEPISSSPTDKKRDVWGVAFGHSFGEERCVCIGYDSGDLKLVDLRTGTTRWETNVTKGICSIQFTAKHESASKLLVTTVQSTVRLFDFSSTASLPVLEKSLTEPHNSTVWSGKFVPQNRNLFLTCNGVGSFNLYKYNSSLESQLICSSEATLAPILNFDFHPEKLGLAVSISTDRTLKISYISNLQPFLI